jgi:transposase InsO family protein
MRPSSFPAGWPLPVLCNEAEASSRDATARALAFPSFGGQDRSHPLWGRLHDFRFFITGNTSQFTRTTRLRLARSEKAQMVQGDCFKRTWFSARMNHPASRQSRRQRRNGKPQRRPANGNVWAWLKNGGGYTTRAQVTHDFSDYVEAYYNRVRRHSSLGHQTPVDFENQLNQNKPVRIPSSKQLRIGTSKGSSIFNTKPRRLSSRRISKFYIGVASRMAEGALLRCQ